MITAIIVNRKTLEFTRACLESLLEFYPQIEVLLVDNRSGEDASLEYVKASAAALPNVRCHLITSGRPHHARGLNAGVSLTSTPYFLTLDSDVIVLRGGWVEKMSAAFQADSKLFAIGNLCRNAGKGCVTPPRRGQRGSDFVHPFCAMWDSNKYKSLGARFAETGQPACHVCINAVRRGYHLKDMEGIHPHNKASDLYVHHAWGGTRTRLAVLTDCARRRAKNE